MRQTHALSRHSIKIRSLERRMAVAPQTAVTEIVGQNDDYIGWPVRTTTHGGNEHQPSKKTDNRLQAKHVTTKGDGVAEATRTRKEINPHVDLLCLWRKSR